MKEGVVIPRVTFKIREGDQKPSDKSINPLAAVNADIAFSSNLPNASDSTPNSPRVPTVASKPPAKPYTAA